MKKLPVLLILSILLLSCNREEENRKITVITTTSFVTDTVSRIAGDRVELINLIEYGQDPHSYEPSPRDIARVENADIIFVNGFDLEEGLLNIFESVNGSKIVELSSTVDFIESPEEEDHHGIDPHTWMSPLNVIKWSETAAESLIKINGVNKEYYEANKSDYIRELIDLHEKIQNKLSVIDVEQRVMITDHDSLAYFAREYNFKIPGTIIPGTSSNSDTSARALIDLIKLIERTGVQTIFIGETAGPDMAKLTENIRSELNSPVKIVKLKSGSLDKPGTGADTYLDYMDYNTDLILNGLTGD